MNLHEKKCVPCEGGTQPLSVEKVGEYLPLLKNQWSVLENKKILHEFTFETFTSAITFVNKVAAIAETEGHHPDIHIHYNKVVIELWTHAINGLSENDFIVAAKIEKI